MYSRAYMLLDIEYSKLQEEVAWGIKARPADDSLFHWVAKINGPKDTIWEGGIFVVNLRFNEYYNQQPPQVYFHTIPFHPNIDMENGRPCVDFLDEFGTWKENYGIQAILITLQQLLANPILENPVNEEAAGLLFNAPHKYRQMVLDCVATSQRINVTGMTLSQEDGKDVARPRVKFEVEEGGTVPTAQQGSTLLFKPLSFDEYHTTWQGIATSKPRLHAKNSLLETLKNDSKLQTIHYGLQMDELQDQMSKQLNEHNSMMYGKFAGRMGAGNEVKDKRMSQINKMRKIYLQSNKNKSPRDQKSLELVGQVPVSVGEGKEPWEEEIDDMIEWTNKLDEVEEVGEV